MKKIRIGTLRKADADNSNLIDLSAIRFSDEVASVRFEADFEITEQEEKHERSE